MGCFDFGEDFGSVQFSPVVIQVSKIREVDFAFKYFVIGKVEKRDFIVKGDLRSYFY